MHETDALTKETDLEMANVRLPDWCSGWLIPLCVAVLTILGTVMCFPPFHLPEVAYAFAAPALLWAYREPSFKRFARVVLGAEAVAWTLVLGWLHHVTWVGLFLLGPFVGLWVGSWFLLARWALPRMVKKSTPVRLAVVLGLAGAWVVIEWTRTWFLTGFPWLPLAASQWERPSILQIASYTGAWGVSFVLIMVNLGFTAYAHRLLFEGKRGFAKRSQEFLLAMFLLLVCLAVHVQEAFNRLPYTKPLARVGIVQPSIPQQEKWDQDFASKIYHVLEDETAEAAKTKPDLILWPEASTPWPILGDAQVKAWIDDLDRRTGVPLMLGSLGIENPDTDQEAWLNAVFLVDPVSGLNRSYYAKRKRVPFGEYVPLRPILGWLSKFAPIGDDLKPGDHPVNLPVVTADGAHNFSPLICYEDVFPSLARDSVKAGADVLVVNTNNAWFGQGGAAYQHAAHSVLRAVETRRPVLRSGNSGWSGWIDEFGNIRGVLRKAPDQEITTDPTAEGTVYFRGTAILDVTRDERWQGRETFYVKYGDWFVLLSAALAGYGWMLLRNHRRDQNA